MKFSYAQQMQDRFPQRISGVLRLDGIAPRADVTQAVAHFSQHARARLADQGEGTLPEIQAWRRAFSTMGLKPTQYRCAAEALLRRFRKEGSLPVLTPLVDLCNAVSLAYAIPIAVFDLDRIAGDLTVRHAAGTEDHTTFSGHHETPPEGEVIFADSAGHAHARRWANRQSALSAVRPTTTRALIVAEALHETARADITRLVTDLQDALAPHLHRPPVTGLLATPDAVFEDNER